MVKKGTIVKWLILSVLIIYSVTICIWARGESDKHVCEGIDIEVKGNTLMDSIIKRGVAEELTHYSGKLVGAHLSEINTGDVEKYLSGLSNFESVNCMISSGGRLRIEIVPLVPVMRVFLGDKSYYINREGKHIESKAEFYTDVPVVTGNFNKGFQPQSVLPIIRFIEEDDMLRDLTSMIEAKDANDIILIPRITGHVINFGDTTRLQEKRDALSLFYIKVMPYKGWNEYDTISVKFRGQIVATRSDKSKVVHQEEVTEDIDPDEATLQDHLPETAATVE